MQRYKISLSTLALAAAAFATSPAAVAAQATGAELEAGTFFYVIDSVTMEAGRCSTMAADVATQFSNVTGFPVTRTTCGDRGNGFGDIRLTYTADAAAKLVSTDGEVTPDVSPGRYATKAACDATLAAEKANFARVTGLQPVVAYCKPENEVFRGAWIQRIDAFGVAAVQPRYAGTIITEYPTVGDIDDLPRQIEGLLRAHNVEPRWVSVKSSAGTHQITVFYYADKPVRLRAERYATVQNEAQCRAELQHLNGVLTRAAVGASLTLCTEGLLPKLDVWGVTVNAALALPGRTDEAFPTYDVCSQTRQDVIDSHNNGSNRVIHGGLCSYGGFPEHWSVRLIQATVTTEGGL